MGTKAQSETGALGVPEWTITDRLRKARENAGLSPEQLAHDIDVSRATVYNYESPAYERKRRPIALKAWAVRCGVPYEWVKAGTVALTDKGPDSDPTQRIRPSGCTVATFPTMARRGAPVRVLEAA